MGIGTLVSAVGIGLNLFGTSRAKKDAEKAQREQIAFDTKSAKLESTALLEEAALTAIEIRREGKLLGKSQTALTAKAGIKLGRGTAKDIQAETKRLTEKDVATTQSAAERKSEQLLATFEAGNQEFVPTTELEKLRKRDAQLTALETAPDGTLQSNFIKSKEPNKNLFGGL